MAKDAFYFSHDANAVSDPKILAMRCDYGMEGYGIYWGIIEMLRSQSDYRLNRNKNTFRAMKIQFATNVDIEAFVNNCIYEYELFICDDDSFWSDSLLRRMEYFEEVKQRNTERAKRAGLASAEKRKSTQVEHESTTSQLQVEQELNASQLNKEKKRKEKEIKEKEIKEKEIFEVVDDAISYYSNNIGLITPIIADKINAWTNDLSDEVIKLAIDISVEQNTRKWAYVEAILKEWHERGAGTVDDCKSLMLEHKNKRKKVVAISGNSKQEQDGFAAWLSETELS